ncbi:MAG: hypothetical protein N2746_09450 [Deltaproteobacteria bacterium]|nr:hypothetical protein [Deltaproteobacteria bacterium]
MKKIFWFLIVFSLFIVNLSAKDITWYLQLLRENNPDMEVKGVFSKNSYMLISNLSERFSSNSPIESTKYFLRRYGPLFSIEGDIDIILDKVLYDREGIKTIKFYYTYKGYPVYPATIIVTIENSKTISRVSFFNLSIQNISTSVSFNREDAFYLVLNKYVHPDQHIGTKFTDSSVREIVLLLGGSSFFTYEVRIASLVSFINTSYFIDAKTGRLLYKKSNIVYLNKARVYYPNPGVDGKNPTVEVDIENLDPNVSDKTLTGTLIRSNNCHGKGEEREFTLPQYQATMKFRICNIGPKAKSDENGDFYFTPDDPTKCFNPEDSQVCFESVMEDDFAEVMMYYHADKMYSYFKTMGFDKINTNSGLPSLVTVVNFKLPNFMELRFNCEEDPNNPGWNICTTDKFMPFDNAAFIPYDGSFEDFGIYDDAIVFGQGERVDFAYDAEVTYHEFTHAMIGSTSNLAYAFIDQYGMYIDPGAMNEAFADYFSSTVSGDPRLGEYVSNATEDVGALRDLSVNVRCPDDLWGESHNDGLLLSNALWKIRTEFVKDFGGEKILDQKIYDVLVSLSEIATFSDFTKGLVESLKKDVRIGESFAKKAENIFAENNILSCERLVNMENGKLIMLVEGLDMVGLSPYVPGYIQFYFDMPNNVSKFMLDMDIYSNSMFGNSVAEIRVLMKRDYPIEFEVTPDGSISSNADFEIESMDNSHFEVKVPKIEGGHRYYIAFVNYGGAQGILQFITPSVETKPLEQDAGVDTVDGAITDTIVFVDVIEDVEITQDVVEDASGVDAGVSVDTQIISDTGIKHDVIVVIEGTNTDDSGQESGCSCSVLE